MRKNMCSQKGKCSECGKTIIKYVNHQPWIDEEDYSETCDKSEDHKHKLAPF